MAESDSIVKKLYERGFTLIELMVAIVIIAILAGIGFPMYIQQVERARRADGTSVAMLIALAQERFFTLNSTYTIDLTESDLRLSSKVQSGLSESGHYNVAVTPGLAGIATSFVVTVTPIAGGSQMEDEECRTMMVDQIGAKTALDKSSADSTNICW